MSPPRPLKLWPWWVRTIYVIQACAVIGGLAYAIVLLYQQGNDRAAQAIDQARANRHLIREVGRELDVHARASGKRACAEVTLLADALHRFHALPPRQVDRLRQIGCRVVLPFTGSGYRPGESSGSSGPGTPPSSGAPNKPAGPRTSPSGSAPPGSPSPSAGPSPSGTPTPKASVCVGPVCVSVSPIAADDQDHGELPWGLMVAGAFGLLILAVMLRRRKP